MRKEKYLQIFNYLKEFSKIRSKPVRDIEAQETQYPEKFWLHDIPVNKLFENIIRPDFNSDNNYWLKIRKPKEIGKPRFPKLSDNLELWIEPLSLLNEDKEPYLKKAINKEGNTLVREDFPQIAEELEKYIDSNWIDDLHDYNEKFEQYNKEYKIYETLNNTYKKLFRIFNKTQQFGEEYELVVGVGLLHYKADSDSPKIFRHVITQRVDIKFEYSQKDSQIYVNPNLESSPQIETDAIVDLSDLFDSQNIIEAERNVEKFIQDKDDKSLDHLFDTRDKEGTKENIEDALEMFAARLSADARYKNQVEKPSSTSTKPLIYYSPALLLRKRNTRSFTALYDRIIMNIENENENDEIEIPAINDLIGIHDDSENNFLDSSTPEYINKNEPIFFPKAWNDEQIEIVEKSRRNNKVLVQGPPGTGKSHTIANLICHLLANGKKVLITAYTKRALEVLKDKLPKEFQNLVVNLLSGDPSSINDLKSSVNSINEELSRANLNNYQNEITKLGKEIKSTREKIATYTNELVKIKEKATRTQEVNSVYSGTVTEIAEKLEKDSICFDWYKDSFDDIHNSETISELKLFIEQNENYKDIDLFEFTCRIPKIDSLPSVEQIRDYRHTVNRLSEYKISKNEYPLIECSDYSELKIMLNELSQIYNQKSLLQIEFADIVIKTYLNGNAYQWKQKIKTASQIISRLKEFNLKEIDRDVEITYNLDISLKQLKSGTQILLNYLNEGNALSGVSFTFKKKFLSKEMKERLNFVDNIRVNGSPCDTIEEFNTVIRDIELQQNFDELSEIWDSKFPQGSSYFNKFIFFKNIGSEITKLISNIEQAEEICSKIEDCSTLSISLFGIEDVNDLIDEVDYNYDLNKEKSFKKFIEKAESHLTHNNIHPIVEKIIKNLKDIDWYSYDTTLNELKSFAKKKVNYQKFKQLESSLHDVFPDLIESIISDCVTFSELSKFNEAIYFKHAQNEINRLMAVDEKLLFKDLQELEKKEKNLVAKIASKKAWSIVVERLKENWSLQQQLNAWAMAVEKIGITGKGKKAIKFRKIAQQKMEHCKDSVPCWIMPLYKVAETIRPEQEMYDYVIIDEASQLGPDAIFLLYITKNIIIVGDDKQTSPEYVGVDANTMTPYIERHLKDIPFSDYYGPEFSFFDHAKLFCEGVTVLREHFRCMPEIIEFSNKYFYAPDGKGLYPLKQYSENRLKPLECVFCSNGYIEGKWSRIINEPEAEMIANTITKLIEDERYNNKTFGVITLQGNQQSNLIENLLLKHIGEHEYHERKIICGNSASFQGDERDIMFLSLVTAHNHNRSALVKPADERRFNVAMSRAIEQVWLFHSVQLEDLSNTNDLRYKLLNYFKNYNVQQPIHSKPVERNIGTQPEPFDSWFEVDVYNDIIRKGHNVIPQYKVAKGKYIIDLVALLNDGTKIAIECDGDKWHGAEQYQNDIMRQKVLERCGWQFFRVRGYEYYTNRQKALEPLWEMLAKVKIAKPLKMIEEEQKEITEIIPIVEAPASSHLSNIAHHNSNDLFSKLFQKQQEHEVDNESEVESDSLEILRYFNLFKSGVYILTTEELLDVDYVVEIKANQKNGYLLQCYDTGYINKVLISVLLSKKIGKEYKNGLNANATLKYLKIIKADEIIGLFFNENGNRKFKAHLTKNISNREQLHLQGYKVIYNDFDDLQYKTFPIDLLNDIERLVFQSFTALGKPMTNIYYKNEWSIIKPAIN